MAEILIDSNLILDVATADPIWGARSTAFIEALADRNTLVVNPIIYAEVSVGYTRIEELEAALPVGLFRRDPLPWEAAFLAGKCFLRYRRNGGARRSPLPDFYIGAHAAVLGMTLATRDQGRYRSYFPRLPILSPE